MHRSTNLLEKKRFVSLQEPKSTSPDKDGEQKSFLRVLSNTGWLTGSRLASDFAGLLLFIALSRIYGPSGIGVYAYGFAIGGITASILNLGVEDYAIRECARLSREKSRELLGRLLGTQLGLGVIVTLCLLGFVYTTASSFGASLVILFLAVYESCRTMSRTLFVPAFAQEKMAGPAIIEVSCIVGTILVSLSLAAWANVSLPVAIAPFPIGSLLLLVLALFSAKRYHGSLQIRISRATVTEVIHSIWPFAASVIVYHIYARADLVMISLMLGDEAAGIYASSLKFLETGTVPLLFLGIAVYPTLSSSFQGDRERFVEIAERFFRGALIIGTLLAWALFYVVPLILVPLLGGDFSASIPVAKSLALLALLIPVETVGLRLLLAADRQVERVKLQFAGTVFNIVLNLVMIPMIGIIGAVLASVATYIIVGFLYLYSLSSHFKVTRLIRPVWSYSIMVGASVSSGIVTSLFFASEWLPAFIFILVFSASTLITGFLSVSYIFNSMRKLFI